MSYYSLVKIFSNDPYCLTKKVLFLLEGYSFLFLYCYIFLSFVPFLSFFLKLCRLFQNWISLEPFVFLSSSFSFIFSHPYCFVLYFLDLLLLELIFFTFTFFRFLNNNFPSLLYQKNLSIYPFYNAALPLFSLCSSFCSSVVSSLSLFQVSLFYRIWFFCLSFAFSVCDFFLTCFWDFCNFLSVYLLVGHFYIFMCFCLFLISFFLK